ncbi:hypothetical protein [Streptomyces sp. CB09001]|uniref:hypothetical protein n=1 Tax=Streptomyces sp. CB09001 TaxID=2083284 RepID=UPI001F07ED16|nr:hypothetical protein [Streptomyces sp. CB09001]
MPIRMRLTLRRPLATAAPAHLSAERADRTPLGPWADTPTPTLDRSRTSARVPFVGGTHAFTRAVAGTSSACPAPAPHPTHRVPKGGR